MTRNRVFASVLFLAITCVATALHAEDGKVLFAEQFDSKLSEGWSWVRESPKDWRIENGALELHTLPGYLHAGSNNSKNILLRAAPEVKDTPVAIEVLVEGEPQVLFEHAGPVWYVDDDNYISLFQESLAGKSKLQMVIEKEGKPKTAVSENDAKTVWLRLLVTPKKITGQFRVKETDPWEKVGEGDLPAGPAKVGIMSGGAPEKSDRRVRFQSFRIVESK